VTSPNDVNYNVYIQDPVYNHADTVAPSLKLDFKLGQSITLTSITGYSFTRNDLLFDSQSAMAPAGSGIPYYALVRNYRDTSDTSYQQELRLTSGTDSPLTWIAGAYFLKRVTPYPGDTQVLSPPPFFSPMSTVDYDVKFDDEQYAGFGSASYRFAEKWEATVGLRVNRSQNTYTDFLHNETVVVGGAREVIPAGTPSEVDETAVLPRGEVSYHFNPDLMLYASVSEGVQPGAASVITSTTGQPFEREKTTAYELGEKGEFLDHRLSVDGSLYYIAWKDIQLQLSDSVGLGYNANGGRAKSGGVNAFHLVGRRRIKAVALGRVLRADTLDRRVEGNLCLCLGGQIYFEQLTVGGVEQLIGR